jgi:hypothetical protein
MKKFIFGIATVSILATTAVFASGNNAPLACGVSEQTAETLPFAKGLSDLVGDVFTLRGGNVEDMRIRDIKQIVSSGSLYAFLLGFKTSLLTTHYYGANDFRNELCGEAIYKSALMSVSKKVKKGMSDADIIELFNQEATKQRTCEMIFKK